MKGVSPRSGRDRLAHGASRGNENGVQDLRSPVRGGIRVNRVCAGSDAAPAESVKFPPSPVYPRLAPWAIRCRRSRGLRRAESLKLALVGVEKCIRLAFTSPERA